MIGEALNVHPIKLWAKRFLGEKENRSLTIQLIRMVSDGHFKVRLALDKTFFFSLEKPSKINLALEKHLNSRKFLEKPLKINVAIAHHSSAVVGAVINRNSAVGRKYRSRVQVICLLVSSACLYIRSWG